jgi:predicted O-linked N-acetylglucosamine transferase (SPINDLY family)
MPSISRNQPCPCGSGRRYKQCCGASAAPASAAPSTQDAFAQALALHQSGHVAEAERVYVALREAGPANASVLHYLGVARHQRGDHETAARHIREALRLNHGEAMAHSNLGLVLMALRQLDEALRCFDEALRQDPDNLLAYNNRGLVLHDLRRFEEAAADFLQATTLRADFVEAFVNLGKTRLAQKRYALALAACDTAVALAPALAAAHAMRGSVLRELRRQDEALQCWARALALQPDFAEVHFNSGGALHELRRFEEAAACLTRAFALKPDMPYLRGDLLHDRMQCCDWRGFEATAAELVAAVERGERVCNPFGLLTLPSTTEQQQRCARLLVADKFPDMPPKWSGEGYRHDRLRIAYVSADFRDHPVAHLIAGMIERHDRMAFAVTGIYVGPPATDEWHQRMVAAFDHFHDVGARSDEEIAGLIRSLEVDIAIDLGGHTGYSRIGVFALRPAPVQVTYLGYPGPVGMPGLDYVIADAVVIPPEQRPFYDEKVACVSRSYMVNDSTKAVADRQILRADMNLPDDGFVFCSFNGHFKITPDVFSVWMRLLANVDNSVLWLTGGNDTVMRNLRREAHERGIAPERLVFSQKLSLADHLARHRCADLFVDTFHYNAHTTASDALWAGLPVLTRRGETFASRVAASLLGALGLPELIAQNTAEYEAMALELARQPQRLAAIRQKLAANRLTYPLFDSGRSTREMESLYRLMHSRQQSGLPPDHIAVTA